MTAREWFLLPFAVVGAWCAVEWIARATVLSIKWKERRAEMRQRGRP